MTQPATPERILQLGLAFWGSKTLLSAVELGVFSELARVEHLVGPDSMVVGIKERAPQ